MDGLSRLLVIPSKILTEKNESSLIVVEDSKIVLMKTAIDHKLKSSLFKQKLHTIKPKTRVSKIETIKEIICAWGMNPEELLTKKALTEPHRTVISPGYEEDQVETLSNALKEMMRKELLTAQSERV